MRDKFLTAASHDLRSPLTVILAHVGLIRTELDRARPISADWPRKHLTSMSGSRAVTPLVRR